MNSQPARAPSVADLAREENATPEEIVASALALYAVTDEEMGVEAVRLVKESRRRRAASRE